MSDKAIILNKLSIVHLTNEKDLDITYDSDFVWEMWFYSTVIWINTLKIRAFFKERIFL